VRTERIAHWPDAAVAGLVVVGCAVIGGPLGWLWQHLAPRTLAYVTTDGFVIPQESESQIAADGRALFIAAAAGLVIGIGLWQWRSRRGPWLVLAAVLGASGTAGVMALSGDLLSGGRTGGAAGEVFTLPVQIQAPAVLLGAPLLALLSHSFGALFIAHDDLGRPDPDPASPGGNLPVGHPAGPAYAQFPPAALPQDAGNTAAGRYPTALPEPGRGDQPV
jgi:hypothetical protein